MSQQESGGRWVGSLRGGLSVAVAPRHRPALLFGAVDDPVDDDELGVARRLLEGRAAARGISGLEVPEERLRAALASGGLELRLSAGLIRALKIPPDLFLLPSLDHRPGEPSSGDSRELILANLARLGAALPPAPRLSPAEAGGILERCERIAARAAAPPGTARD